MLQDDDDLQGEPTLADHASGHIHGPYGNEGDGQVHEVRDPEQPRRLILDWYPPTGYEKQESDGTEMEAGPHQLSPPRPPQDREQREDRHVYHDGAQKSDVYVRRSIRGQSDTKQGRANNEGRHEREGIVPTMDREGGNDRTRTDGNGKEKRESRRVWRDQHEISQIAEHEGGSDGNATRAEGLLAIRQIQRASGDRILSVMRGAEPHDFGQIGVELCAIAPRPAARNPHEAQRCPKTSLEQG